jgi:hypothetical protein
VSTNPPSFRFPFNTDPDTFPESDEKGWKKQVHQAIRYAFSGLLDLNQAVPAILSKITASTSPTSTSSGGNTIGTTNNRSGVAAYTLQNSDYGALVVVNNAAGVAVSLNSRVTKPYYSRIKVDSGSGVAVLTPVQGTVNGAGFVNIAAGTTLFVYYNSVDGNWTTG